MSDRELLEVLVSKIEQIEAKVNRIDQIEAKVNRIDQIEAKVNKIDQIEAKVNGIDQIEAKIDRIDQIEVQLNENTQIAKAILHRQEETDAKIESMAMDMHKMNGEITSIKEQTITNTEKINEINSIVKELQKIERQQEQTINLLSRRSIDLEAELRSLKQ